MGDKKNLQVPFAYLGNSCPLIEPLGKIQAQGPQVLVQINVGEAASMCFHGMAFFQCRVLEIAVAELPGRSVAGINRVAEAPWTPGGFPVFHHAEKVRHALFDDAASVCWCSGNSEEEISQIGNSVPPALGMAVGVELKKLLQGDSGVEEWRGDQKCWVAEDITRYRVV